MDELTIKADEAEALRSELEEYREAVERMATMEIALQKYERDAQERVDLEDQIKVCCLDFIVIFGITLSCGYKLPRLLMYQNRPWNSKTLIF